MQRDTCTLWLCLLMSCTAGAQEPGPEAAVLGGPPVPDAVARTLVRSDAMGRFQRIEGRPEEAALSLLTLEPDCRERARAVVAEREMALGRHLIDNIDLVKEATDAIRSGNQAEARRLAGALYDRFDPEHRRDPLRGPLVAVLPPAAGADLERLVDGYWEAWVRASGGGDEGNGGARAGEMEGRLAFTLFQEEIRSAYERTLRPYHDKLERIYQAVDPTPQQRAAIREAVIGYIRQTRLKPDGAQRDMVARRVYEVLDEERRIRLVAAALAQV